MNAKHFYVMIQNTYSSPISELNNSFMAPPYFSADDLLSQAALNFLYDLESRFGQRRRDLLRQREVVQCRINNGFLPEFNPFDSEIKRGSWKVAPIPACIQDRRVEITGPTDRKMVINALNSGAKVFMADFEDSNSPTWHNIIQGQLNLYEAVRGTIEFSSPEGKQYKLQEKTAVLFVRPRGWHLEEKNISYNGLPLSASLFDFGLFFFHNAKYLATKGEGPFFYLPKIESSQEAQLWNDVFVFAQQKIGMPLGTIKATVLIETILAAFQMDEILYELKEHSAGLNCGRWDYIFSYIKKLGSNPHFILPEREQVTMLSSFMRNYSKLLIQTCHKRGAHAMGGMAAFIPIKNDEQANAKVMEKVYQDKLREVSDGHDGTWVAHPGLIPVALKAFDEYMPEPNQIHKTIQDYRFHAADLLNPSKGTITIQSIKRNADIGLQYIEAWLSGNGCVPIYNLMEDAATAEICRAQLWQWAHHKLSTEEGLTITSPFINAIIDEYAFVYDGTRKSKGEKSNFFKAAELLKTSIATAKLDDFLTTKAYQFIS